jgi:hypothetical protein
MSLCRSGDQLGTSSDPFHGTQPDVASSACSAGVSWGVDFARLDFGEGQPPRRPGEGGCCARAFVTPAKKTAQRARACRGGEAAGVRPVRTAGLDQDPKSSSTPLRRQVPVKQLSGTSSTTTSRPRSSNCGSCVRACGSGWWWCFKKHRLAPELWYLQPQALASRYIHSR